MTVTKRRLCCLLVVCVLSTGQSITVVSSPFAPRKLRPIAAFAERQATLILRAMLSHWRHAGGHAFKTCGFTVKR